MKTLLMSLSHIAIYLAYLNAGLFVILGVLAFYEKINPAHGKTFKKRRSRFLLVFKLNKITFISILVLFAFIALLTLFGLIALNFFNWR